MAPDYTEGGFMRGNLVKITIGDYITDMPGIIRGISYGYPDEGGWDIARNELGQLETDAYIMPKLIDVKGIKFTPIHNFIPQTVSNAFVVSGSGNNVDAPFITFGKTTGAGGSGNNPGSSIAAATNVADQQNGNFSNGSSSSINPASSFNSFVGNIFNQAGLDNDFSLLKNQQDQSGIKPMLVFECKNCEFDFTESTPIQNELYAGTASGSATPESQKFKIHVGRVRMRNQYPNIRLDGKPLILGDSWDAARSSVQANPADNSNDILSLGGELLTNFVSNSLNDLIYLNISFQY
jgi:hypothetical protein